MTRKTDTRVADYESEYEGKGISVLSLSRILGTGLLFLAILVLASCGGAGGVGTTTYTIGGTVSGLSGSGLVLEDNGGDDLSINASGSFTFATHIADGAIYAVTVLTQPTSPNQVCTVSNASGTLSGTNVTNVAVNCANAYTVGGTVSGLTGTLLIRNNGTDDYTLTANGNFTFSTLLTDGSGYDVTVSSQPANLSCVASNGTGTISAANVTNVSLTCAVPKIFMTVYGSSPSGDLGGISGADSNCMGSANYPGAGIYKALIVDGVSRIASLTANAGDGQVDWVLRPNTSYYRADGTTLVGTTDANGLFTFPLTNSISTTSSGFWDGLNTDWTASGNNCSLWTDSSGGGQGTYGYEAATSSMALVWNNASCNASGAILACVQQ